MLFGRKGEPRKVSIDGAMALAEESFAGRLGNMGRRTGEAAEGLGSARDQFICASEEFDGLDAEPYTEDLYNANIAFIKSQKGLYAKAISRVVGGLDLGSGSGNAYARCSGMLASAERTRDEILKTNATFKIVIHCYSDHLGSFKKAISSMEKLMGSLRGELDRHRADFERYDEISRLIARLRELGTELGSLGESASMLEEGLAGTESHEAKREEIRKRIDGKRSESKELEASYAGMSGRVSTLLAPLDRAARKLDHMPGRRARLHPFIADPVGSLTDRERYEKFRGLVQELKEGLEKGEIDVKNREEVAGNVQEALDYDLYSAVESIKGLGEGRARIAEEIKAMEEALTDIGKGKTAMEKKARDAESMRRRAEEVGTERSTTAKRVEELFDSYYGIRVSVDLT